MAYKEENWLKWYYAVLKLIMFVRPIILEHWEVAGFIFQYLCAAVSKSKTQYLQIYEEQIWFSRRPSCLKESIFVYLYLN